LKNKTKEILSKIYSQVLPVGTNVEKFGYATCFFCQQTEDEICEFSTFAVSRELGFSANENVNQICGFLAAASRHHSHSVAPQEIVTAQGGRPLPAFPSRTKTMVEGLSQQQICCS
jgi:hypothetical protein